MEPIASSTQDSLLQRTSEEEEDDFSKAWHLVSGSVFQLSMRSAIELDVFDILAEAGPGAKLSAAQIVGRMPKCSNPDAPVMLDRILGLLASHSVLSCAVIELERFYGLTSVAKYFVANQDGVSLGPLIKMLFDDVLLASWSHLKDAIQDGGLAFDKAHGVNVFEYLGANPKFNKVFNTAMFNHTNVIINKILVSYNGFEDLKQLVDVGGGLGVALEAIITKYPHIKGINFDLPHVIEHTKPRSGIEYVGGDMFENVPKGDAIFMKWILHDWSDKHCLTILKNCYNAIPDDGMVIVVDEILPVMPKNSLSVQATFESNVLMMTHNSGGKERTKDEFLALANGAGFSGIRFQCFVCNCWVMEFFK